MYCTRSALIELIEQVDSICVDNHPIIMELVQWLPTATIESFMEDARAALDLGEGWQTNDDIEYPVQGPNWPSAYEEPEPPTDLVEEIESLADQLEESGPDYFFNEGVKAAEAAKQKRIEQYREDRERRLQLMQCSEV